MCMSFSHRSVNESFDVRNSPQQRVDGLEEKLVAVDKNCDDVINLLKTRWPRITPVNSIYNEDILNHIYYAYLSL